MNGWLWLVDDSRPVLSWSSVVAMLSPPPVCVNSSANVPPPYRSIYLLTYLFTYFCGAAQPDDPNHKQTFCTQLRESCLRNRQSRRSADSRSSPSPRSWTLTCAATQPHIVLVSLRDPGKYMDCYLFTDPEGMKDWVRPVGWPIADTIHVYPRSGHMSTIDQAQSRKSPPAKDRRPKPLSHADHLKLQIFVILHILQTGELSCKRKRPQPIPPRKKTHRIYINFRNNFTSGKSGADVCTPWRPPWVC